MSNVSVNKLFKNYKNSGGTKSFKEFVDGFNRGKNASNDSSLNDMFANASGTKNIGENPIEQVKETIAVKEAAPVVNDTSVDNMTFGINNYVIGGTLLIIIGALSYNYYSKHKK
jgi:hypothetical protein